MQGTGTTSYGIALWDKHVTYKQSGSPTITGKSGAIHHDYGTHTF